MKILISSNFKKHFDTYIDFIDHYWLNYFSEKKHEFLLVPNSKKMTEKLIKINKNIDLIIIPGGNDLFEKNKISKIRLKVEDILIKFSIVKKIPLLGVCRGMQHINHYFGGSISKIKNHMRKSHNIHLKDDLFHKDKMIVNSYHNYGIKNTNLAKKFKIQAVDSNNNIEMFEHIQKKIIGVMWHPEREKDYKKLELIIKKLVKKK